MVHRQAEAAIVGDQIEPLLIGQIHPARSRGWVPVLGVGSLVVGSLIQGHPLNQSHPIAELDGPVPAHPHHRLAGLVVLAVAPILGLVDL